MANCNPHAEARCDICSSECCYDRLLSVRNVCDCLTHCVLQCWCFGAVGPERSVSIQLTDKSPRETNRCFLHAAGLQLRLHPFSALFTLGFSFIPPSLLPCPKQTLRSLHYKGLEPGMWNPSYTSNACVCLSISLFIYIYFFIYIIYIFLFFTILFFLHSLPCLHTKPHPPLSISSWTLQSTVRKQACGSEDWEHTRVFFFAKQEEK